MADRLNRKIGPAQLDLGLLLDGLPVGVAVLDLTGNVLFLNRALEALSGYSREETVGVPCRHVLRSRACLQGCPVKVLAQDGEPGPSLETDCINRHRRRIPVRLTAVPVKDREGRTTCILDVVEDLSAVRELEGRLTRSAGPGQIVGRSPVMERLLRLVPVVAQGDAPVLITGETGTGKDLLAEAVHKASPRSREPFVRFSCAPMSEALLECELFGRCGPGSEETRAGRFQQANNGTLYLSEIADLPPGHQAALVRYLDERVVLPSGAQAPARVNVRLIASTGAAPEKLLREGRLREDLFHRLSVVRLHLPPLRERGEDMAFLLHHFLGIYAARFKKNVTGFSPKALRLLTTYPYPGNIRELRNIVEYAVMVCSGDQIQRAHLPAHLPGAHESLCAPCERPRDAAPRPARKARKGK